MKPTEFERAFTTLETMLSETTEIELATVPGSEWAALEDRQFALLYALDIMRSFAGGNA